MSERRFVPSFGLNLPEKAIVDGREEKEERRAKFRPAASLFIPIKPGLEVTSEFGQSFHLC